MGYLHMAHKGGEPHVCVTNTLCVTNTHTTGGTEHVSHSQRARVAVLANLTSPCRCRPRRCRPRRCRPHRCRPRRCRPAPPLPAASRAHASAAARAHLRRRPTRTARSPSCSCPRHFASRRPGAATWHPQQWRGWGDQPVQVGLMQVRRVRMGAR